MVYNYDMWPFKHKKSPEMEPDDDVEVIIDKLTDLTVKLDEALIVIKRIDQRYYKGKAKDNGEEAPPGDDPWAFMRGLK